LSAFATTAAVALKANSADVTNDLATKVDKVTGKELSTNDYSAAEKAKLAAITGTNTGDQDLSAFATTAAVALKANSADVTNDLATKVDKVTGKELSTNDYSTAEKAKLAAITGSNTGDQVNIAGNAATATKLQATVTINGIAFDGSSNVTIPATGAVPYTGATQAVDLGAYDLKVNGLTVGRGKGNIVSNTATGYYALYANTTGIFNTANGESALTSNTTGYVNTASGYKALYANTTGRNNTAIGTSALMSNITGNFNTASGADALAYNTTGTDNTATGSGALISNTTGAYNTASGSSALRDNTTGDANTATGYTALYSNTTGRNNTATGSGALVSNTTGAYNTASGSSALNSNTTGAANTATGYIALYKNTTGTDNTANGRGALYSNTTGAYNTATGYGALSSNTEGVYNTATGYVALASNTTGLGNQASGNYALTGNTTGNSNAASGYSALRANTTGYSNTASGYSALDANTTGSNNTAIGYYANVGSDNLANATAIGAGATVNASNTIQLGDTNVANVITSGTLTAGAVTYPNVHNTIAGQVLTTNVSGVASWTTPAAGLPSSGNTAGDMLFWNGSAWVKVAAGSNGQTLTFYNGAPAWITNVNTVVNSNTGKIWMDRNLGATQVATSSTDAASYGDLYQWGRGTDGHQIRNSITTNDLSTSDQPGNGKFIVAPNSPYDWRSGQNANLWQGVSGINNPCPSGYRLPTETEWEAERLSWTSSNTAGAFASPLKLPMAGYRNFNSGSLLSVGTDGVYWSSTISSSDSRALFFFTPLSSSSTYYRVFGFSVRCIKDY